MARYDVIVTCIKSGKQTTVGTVKYENLNDTERMAWKAYLANGSYVGYDYHTPQSASTRICVGGDIRLVERM